MRLDDEDPITQEEGTGAGEPDEAEELLSRKLQPGFYLFDLQDHSLPGPRMERRFEAQQLLAAAGVDSDRFAIMEVTAEVEWCGCCVHHTAPFCH